MALPVDLVFSGGPLTTSPVNLVFGEAGPPPVALVTVTGVLPGLSGVIVAAHLTNTTVAGTMPALTGVVNALYISGTARPLVGQAGTHWQVATSTETGIAERNEAPMAQPSGVAPSWQNAASCDASIVTRHVDADHSQHQQMRARFQDADACHSAHIAVQSQDALRGSRPDLTTGFQDADRVQARPMSARHQDGLRDRRNWTAAQWQQGVAQSISVLNVFGRGRHFIIGTEARHQEAMRPPAGTSPGPVIPPVSNPCYTPPNGDAVHLLFVDPWTSSTDLVFVCENHGEDPDASVVVPIKRVYVVLNQSSLRRVDGNIPLPTFSMSMSLDVDSWTWSFGASLPGSALADLQPSSPGEPVLVEAMVNGVPYRMQIEQRSRDRAFVSDGLKISGRGLSALLDSPHSPIYSFTNVDERTAQQLMNDVLTDNGVSIGWDIDYQAVDWSVPADVFSHQGAYISALNAIASAAGSYIQPHPTDQVLHVLPRYPALPWDWDAVTPDFEIPAAVATNEGTEWVDKARYNRVFVSGVQSGVLGQVTRAGTDGGLVAPMVTDPLITTAAAARQRGIPVLADTGSQALITLRMPVLEETGIIVPGKFIRYVDDGVTRIGLTRAVSVDIQSPETWQTISLETHV